MHVGDRVIAQLGELIRGRAASRGVRRRASPATASRSCCRRRCPMRDKFAEALRAGPSSAARSLGDGKMQVSISIGIAAVEQRFKEFVHAFAAAETACKAANDRGRNRVELYQEADESIVRRFTDINLINDLRAAVAEGACSSMRSRSCRSTARCAHPAHFEILLRMLRRQRRHHWARPLHVRRAALPADADDRSLGDRASDRHAQATRGAAAMTSRMVFAINFSGQSLQDPISPSTSRELSSRAACRRARCASSSPRVPRSATSRVPKC